MTTKKAIIRTAASVAALAFCAAMPQGCGYDIDRVMSNVTTLPNFSVLLNNGSSYNLLTLYGMPSVICTFSHEGGQSVKALSLLQDAYDAYGDKVRFILISDGGGSDSVKALWRTHELTMPYSAQEDSGTADKFCGTVPYVCLVNPELQITAEYSGSAMPTAARLKDLIREAL